MRVAEDHRAFGKLAQEGRRVALVAEGTQVIDPQGVDQDQHDIRALQRSLGAVAPGFARPRPSTAEGERGEDPRGEGCASLHAGSFSIPNARSERARMRLETTDRLRPVPG